MYAHFLSALFATRVLQESELNALLQFAYTRTAELTLAEARAARLPLCYCVRVTSAACPSVSR